MAWRAAESDEEAFRPAHSRAAALFPDNVDTEPPCVSKRVFRRPCNARSPAPNRDCQGADVITGIFNGAPDRHGGAPGIYGGRWWPWALRAAFRKYSSVSKRHSKPLASARGLAPNHREWPSRPPVFAIYEQPY